ncbi:MAG: DUF4832 domain-containing protein [Cyclobacteriaceae bacterium]|nr:DUF4832 domain-containing protein [Cyclobacteriaceae bacterium]
MSKIKTPILLVLLAIYVIVYCMSSCNRESPGLDDLNIRTTEYANDPTNFSNPERGFFGQQLSDSNSPSALWPGYLDQLRDINITLVRRLYSMTTFRADPISMDFLQHIQEDLDLIRNKGFKIILRFAYTFNEPEPHNDAPLQVVLSHIDQLTPILQQNADVIALMEGGFIGRWGEWHTSSNGLANPDDMRTILFRLLDVLPENRAVAIRYQQAKKDIYERDDPIGLAQAYNGSNRSRTGHHNDCFVADVDDWGTYWPINEASLNAQKDYLNQENKYLPQEGETCNCNPPGSDCPHALQELERMRWSALNKDYIDCVLDSWATQGCYDEIAKRLGYRFRLIRSEIPKSVPLDSILAVSFTLRNDGYATPYNARDLELVLRSEADGSVQRYKIDSDPRKWLPNDGEIRVDFSIVIPDTFVPGEYEVLLNLPDPEPTLNTDPRYSIRLANQNVWEPGTGYNSLLTDIMVIE